MKLDQKIFEHIPHLRDKIHEPEKSQFRNLDFEALDQYAREAGYPDNWRHKHADREDTRMQSLEGRMNDDLWVFAYGSLMWDPAFYFDEVRVARSLEYQRSFCLRTEIGRGSPSHPGLMAALDNGGKCEGLAFRIRAENVDQETEVIWKREMISYGYVPMFLPLETEAGPVEALAFAIDHSSDRYERELDIDDAAKMIAVGTGLIGSNIAYLDSLADQLKLLGLSDDAFFKLHDLARTYL